MLIAARAVQGSGAALISPLSLTLVSAAFPPGARGKVIGVWGAVTGSAVALGPLVGGLVVQGLSWPWIFWLNVPIGLVAIVATPRLLAESRGPRRPLDLPGTLLASAGLSALIWGILRGNDSGWSSPEILIALGGSAVLLGGFVIRQLRSAAPMVPRHLFRGRDFVAGNLVVFLGMGALMGAAFLIPQYLQSGLHHSVLVTGALLLPWTAAPMFITPVAGALTDRVGNRPLMVAGALLQAAGFLWIALAAGPHTAYAALVAPLLLAGVGVALMFPSSINTVVGSVSPADLGVASAVMASFRQLGGPFGVAILASVFQRDGGFGSPVAFSDGLGPAMTTASVITLGGVIAALAARRAGTAAQARPEPVRAPAEHLG